MQIAREYSWRPAHACWSAGFLLPKTVEKWGGGCVGNAPTREGGEVDKAGFVKLTNTTVVKLTNTTAGHREADGGGREPRNATQANRIGERL